MGIKLCTNLAKAIVKVLHFPYNASSSCRPIAYLIWLLRSGGGFFCENMNLRILYWNRRLSAEWLFGSQYDRKRGRVWRRAARSAIQIAHPRDVFLWMDVTLRYSTSRYNRK